MTARVLPYEEWSRLPEYMDPVTTTVTPSTARMCVVEDDAGEIVARWMVYTVCFAEDLWVRPSCRRRAGVWKLLWRQVHRAATELGFGTVLSTAWTPEAVSLLEHPSVGAELWPAPLMAFPVKER